MLTLDYTTTKRPHHAASSTWTRVPQRKATKYQRNLSELFRQASAHVATLTVDNGVPVSTTELTAWTEATMTDDTTTVDVLRGGALASTSSSPIPIINGNGFTNISVPPEPADDNFINAKDVWYEPEPTHEEPEPTPTKEEHTTINPLVLLALPLVAIAMLLFGLYVITLCLVSRLFGYDADHVRAVIAALNNGNTHRLTRGV